MKKKSRRRKIGGLIIFWVLINIVFITVYFVKQQKKADEHLKEEKKQMATLQGENAEIKDNSYDRHLAVTCDNGTFVGREENGVRSYKGIPYALPPVGNLRWQPPVDAPAGEGVYEAFYFGKSGIQGGRAPALRLCLCPLCGGRPAVRGCFYRAAGRRRGLGDL